MNVRVPRLPLSLDPLIAEAKRRMRRRRLLMGAVLLLLAGSAVGAGLALSRSTATHQSAPVTPIANTTALPPLSGLAARRVWCGDAYNASGRGGCHSRDNRWSIVVNNEGTGCTLTVTSTGTGRHQTIRQPGSGGCVPDLWLGNAFVVQEGIYRPHGRLVSLTPPSRKVKLLARFSTFVVSPNGRWITGEADSSGGLGTSKLVAVMSLASHTCRVAIQAGSNQAVSVDKSPWSVSRSPTSPAQIVFWHVIRRHGVKISVVSGPGTGFTRNSRSVIVGEWQQSTAPPYARSDQRLLKFNLSSLHTPCPAGLAPHS
jgi:hypothetical protein